MTSPKTLPPDPPSLKEGGAAARGCPRCGARPGKPCKARDGTTREPHVARRSPAPIGEPAFAAERRWVAGHVPELPEPFAIGALLTLSGLHGRANVTAAMVRMRVEELYPWAIKEAYCPRCCSWKPRRGRTPFNGRLVCRDCEASPIKGGSDP